MNNNEVSFRGNLGEVERHGPQFSYKKATVKMNVRIQEEIEGCLFVERVD